MANRIGIELLPNVCRIVEIRDQAGLFGRSRGQIRETRVSTYREYPYSPGSFGRLTADLRQALKGPGRLARSAKVVLWGLKANHVGLLLPPAAAGDLLTLARREARSAAGPQAPAETAPSGVSDGIIAGEIRESGRREVGYVSAAPDEIRTRLQPLIDAGFDIQGVVTPALAHSAIVRQRWANAPDAATAVLSVNTRSTAITVLRGTVVLFSRELPWGSDSEFAEPSGGFSDAGGIAGRIASELKRSLVFVKQQRQVDVTQVLVCGDMPDLRTLTGPLMHELNVEIETLDSLEGLDVAHLPGSADEFREKVAALRSACAIAAEAVLPINLMPRSGGLAVSVTRDTQRRLAVAALVAAASVGVVWAGTSYLQSSTRAKIQDLRLQIARLEPEAQRQQEALQAAVTKSARLAALEAFDSQGPRLALVLDAFRQAPHDLAVSNFGLNASPAGTWALMLDGQAKSPTTADAQASFATFLRTASASEYVGLPTRPPVIKIHIEEAPKKDAKGKTVGGASEGPPAITLDQIDPRERPRDVDVVSVRNVRVYQGCEFVGYRVKFIVAIPAWARRQRGSLIYREWDKRVAAYNAMHDDELPCRGGVKVDPRIAAQEAEIPPPAPFVGTVLDFALHFEVKK